MSHANKHRKPECLDQWTDAGEWYRLVERSSSSRGVSDGYLRPFVVEWRDRDAMGRARWSSIDDAATVGDIMGRRYASRGHHS